MCVNCGCPSCGRGPAPFDMSALGNVPHGLPNPTMHRPVCRPVGRPAPIPFNGAAVEPNWNVIVPRSPVTAFAETQRCVQNDIGIPDRRGGRETFGTDLHIIPQPNKRLLVVTPAPRFRFTGVKEEL